MNLFDDSLWRNGQHRKLTMRMKKLHFWSTFLKAMDVFVTTNVLQATQHNLQIRSFFAGLCNCECYYATLVKLYFN